GQILRTGARIEMGPWRLAFFREEYADHGRPYGGRVGGEFAVQKPQPSRRAAREAREANEGTETTGGESAQPDVRPVDDSEI
ncbi:MAG TPA: hypothetical protein VLO31_03400, partial [Cryobacterium sp.]|nr:hypothetical protein [Cryobacterium sp.]